MPHFEFVAKDNHGKNFRGTLYSQTEQGVYFMLEKMGYLVLTVHEREERDQYVIPQRITATDVLVFTRLMAAVISSGMTVLDSLVAIESQTENHSMRKVIRKVRTDVEHGAPLAGAFGRFPRVFPHFYVSMMRSGEISGNMPEVMTRLAGYLEKNEDLRRRIATAFTYPKIVLTLAAVGFTMIIYFVVPAFMKVYEQLKVPLPTQTMMLVGAHHFMVKMWWALPLAAGLVLYSFHLIRTTEWGRKRYHPFVLRLPVVGKINKRVSIAYAARTLGAMLQSGIPLMTALETAKTAANNVEIERDFERVCESVEEGGTVSGPLKISQNFPPLVTSMIASGERSGTLASLLEKSADALDGELEHLVKRFLYYLEPAITIMLVLFVFFLAVSLYVPIFDLIGSMPAP
ncbi:MAG: type II secretion system F family protein [bacterium]